MRKIAVLGAGNGGQTMAADLTLAGHDVRLFEMERFAEPLKTIFETKTIQLTGAITGTAKLSCVTTDIRTAIDGAEVIFIPLPAFAHRGYAELLAGCVTDGQTIVLLPGNLGSLVFKRVFRALGVTADVTICETNSLTYDTRVTGAGLVQVYARNKGLLLGAMPTSRTDASIALLSEFFPFEKAADVLDCGLHSLNPVLHLPGCVLNAARIERSKGEFYLYEEGITPCVARVMEQFERERAVLVNRFGYRLITLSEELAEGRKPRSIWEEVNGCQSLEFIKGPTSLQSRYFTEDLPYGLLAWIELADIAGVDTPVMKSLLTLGGILIETDLWAIGRTKSDMGIDGMDVLQVIA